MTLAAFRTAASWRRFLVTLVASFALVLGALAPHDPASESSGRLEGIEIAAGAHHPGQPVHIESSAIEYHAACLACILQLQTGTTLLEPQRLLPVLTPGGAVATPATAALALVAPRLGPARAPPSPFVLL